MNLFVDLSSHNAIVDFKRLRDYGIEGVWHKASEGLSWNDPRFKDRQAGAAKYGMRFGAYHFARPDLHPKGAEAEALHFVHQVENIRFRDLRPVLDLEVEGAFDKLSPAELVQWARDFNQVVNRELDLVPMFYSYPYYIQKLKAVRPIGNGLWLASYGRNDGKEHPYVVPAPWVKDAAHQFTSNGTVPGVGGRVDLSRARSLRAVLAHPILGVL